MFGLLPVLAGALLAAAALAFVVSPLVAGRRPVSRRPGQAGSEGPQSAAPRDEHSASAVDALREIEFDRETGKLSEPDYVALKAAYTERALSQMRAAATVPPSVPPTPTPTPTPPAASPVCAACGPRPQSDAIYCSRCGRYLPATCARCGAPVTEPAAQFCSACGQGLAT